jgi:hypothetical protein
LPASSCGTKHKLPGGIAGSAASEQGRRRRRRRNIIYIGGNGSRDRATCSCVWLAAQQAGRVNLICSRYGDYRE